MAVGDYNCCIQGKLSLGCKASNITCLVVSNVAPVDMEPLSPIVVTFLGLMAKIKCNFCSVMIDLITRRY
jgi:hypothetical protein